MTDDVRDSYDAVAELYAELFLTDLEGNTRRFDLKGTVDYALRDLTTGQIVTSGKVENFTGYSATGTTVATLAGEQDAQVRLMTILADQIVTRLFAADLTK